MVKTRSGLRTTPALATATATSRKPACACAAGPYRGRVTNAVEAVRNKVSQWKERSVQECIKQAKDLYAKELRSYAKEREFCEYDGYYAVATVLSTFLFYKMIVICLEGEKNTRVLRKMLVAAGTPLVTATMATVRICYRAYDPSTEYVYANSTGCILLLAAMTKIYESTVVQTLLPLFAKLSSAGIKGVRNTASFLSQHWHHLRPVYLAHLLRQSLSAKKYLPAQKLIESNVKKPSEAKVEKEMLLLTYKQPE